MPKIKKTEERLVKEFWEFPDESFFEEETIAFIRHLSPHTLAVERCENKGPPYRKLYGRILYKKGEVLEWMNKK